MNARKKKTSLCISTEAARLVSRLAVKLGVSKTAVYELAIRRLAKEDGAR